MNEIFYRLLRRIDVLHRYRALRQIMFEKFKLLKKKFKLFVLNVFLLKFKKSLDVGIDAKITYTVI